MSPKPLGIAKFWHRVKVLCMMRSICGHISLLICCPMLELLPFFDIFSLLYYFFQKSSPQKLLGRVQWKSILLFLKYELYEFLSEKIMFIFTKIECCLSIQVSHSSSLEALVIIPPFSVFSNGGVHPSITQGSPISYLLLLLYHWIELNKTFTEPLLRVPIVHLLF